jgi:hypothetical protein
VQPTPTSSFRQSTQLRSSIVRGGRRLNVLRGQARLSAEVSYNEERGTDREALAWVVRPRLQWSMPGRGRLDVRYSRTDMISRIGFSALRGPGASSLADGWRLDVISEIRVHRGIVVSGAMVVDHPTGLSPVTQGRMEVRGTF